MSSMRDPRALFIHELQDIYYAEKALTKALPVMVREAGDKELGAGLRKHLEETKGHVEVLEQVFETLGEPAKGQPCPGIDGIKAEHDEFMSEESPAAEISDMFLTGAAARAEHYEIAAYNGLITLARGLGEGDCARLLGDNLREEKEALKTVETIGKRLARDAKQLVAV
jgi:ferritin-like metal-binding protein YciE